MSNANQLIQDLILFYVKENYNHYLQKKKEYLEINVKNDDQLVKIAAIVQRLISTESKGGSADEFGLSDAEKEQLMNAVEEVAADVQ